MRILIVEDEVRVGEFIRSAMADADLDADVATTGAEAQKTFGTTTYDLVILDIMLPDTDGFSLCRQIRAMGSTVPILILSARGLVDDRVRGLDAGADDYLTKPFDTAELDARVRALLRRHREPALTMLSVADVTLDPITRIVKRGTRRLELTAKEFELLEYLLRHAGQTVTRQMLAEHVWGITWDNLTNVIDVFVAHLRRKLETGDEPRLIHAVRGVGYVIRDPHAAD